jgi:hypothetical protein
MAWVRVRLFNELRADLDVEYVLIDSAICKGEPLEPRRFE